MLREVGHDLVILRAGMGAKSRAAALAHLQPHPWRGAAPGRGADRGPRPAASTGRSTEMIYIDLPADLNLEDDEGRDIARLGDAVAQEHRHTGRGAGGWRSRARGREPSWTM